MYGPNPEGLEVGLPVYVRSGDQIGVVKEVTDGRFKVDRPQQPDMWLRTDAVGDVRDGKVILVAMSHELSEFVPEDD